MSGNLIRLSQENFLQQLFTLKVVLDQVTPPPIFLDLTKTCRCTGIFGRIKSLPWLPGSDWKVNWKVFSDTT